MSDFKENIEMSESVQTKTITKFEEDGADDPSTETKNSNLRHRKIPSADLSIVCIYYYYYFLNATIIIDY